MGALVAIDAFQSALGEARRRRYRRREIVFREGDPADSLHVVASGRFAARAGEAIGRTAFVAIYGVGDVFGEFAASRSHQVTTVIALDDGETLSIEVTRFHELGRLHPELVDAALADVAAEVAERERRLVALQHLAAEGRVLLMLEQLADGDGSAVSVTQLQLADLAGTSRATANRVLGDLERDGAVSRRRGVIVVLDLTALRASRGMAAISSSP